ncbi:MAG: hypothetical protein J6S51_05730 [Kiritimatiellae bacterium]|nr:hypothetical protein [Kiritimatiellia bacterium]
MTRQITVSENITRESVFLYDDCGNQVGVLQDGITTGEFFSTIKEKGLAIETITPAKRTCNEYDDERDALAA